MHVLPHSNAGKVMHPWGHGSFTFETHPIQDSALCVSSNLHPLPVIKVNVNIIGFCELCVSF